MDNLLDEIAAKRTFRAAFRGAGGNAQNVPNDEAGNTIIDQFNKPNVDAATAGAAFNQG